MIEQADLKSRASEAPGRLDAIDHLGLAVGASGVPFPILRDVGAVGRREGPAFADLAEHSEAVNPREPATLREMLERLVHSSRPGGRSDPPIGTCRPKTEPWPRICKLAQVVQRLVEVPHRPAEIDWKWPGTRQRSLLLNAPADYVRNDRPVGVVETRLQPRIQGVDVERSAAPIYGEGAVVPQDRLTDRHAHSGVIRPGEADAKMPTGHPPQLRVRSDRRPVIVDGHDLSLPSLPQ